MSFTYLNDFFYGFCYGCFSAKNMLPTITSTVAIFYSTSSSHQIFLLIVIICLSSYVSKTYFAIGLIYTFLSICPASKVSEVGNSGVEISVSLKPQPWLGALVDTQ